MKQSPTAGQVFKPKAAPEIEKFRKQINKLTTAEYAALCVAAKVPRNSGWRFKTGQTLEMSGVRMLAMQRAFLRLQVKKIHKPTKATS